MFSVRKVSFVAALVLVMQLMPVNVRAAGGSISGSVESTGSAIPNICVRVYDAATGILAQSTLTDANGMYTVDGLAPGAYKVLFRDCVLPYDYASEWYDNVRAKGLATPVTVTVGEITQVNASLDPWGAIAGSVEDTDGSAIPNICVRVFDTFNQGSGWARTDANGMYTLKIRTLLGTEDYRVKFYDCVRPFDFAWTWNGNVRTRFEATPVTVTVGETTEVNASMVRWGAVVGSVEDADGSAIPNICVRVRGGGWARTDANGMYTLKVRHPYPGLYQVKFSDCIGPNDYASEWYDDVRVKKFATRVPVTLGETTEVNASLDRWGVISGTVTDDVTTEPIPNICVRVTGNRMRGWARTGADGTYTVKVRTVKFRTVQGTGSYRVKFSDCFEPGRYITEWYDDASIRRLATKVTLHLGETRSGIDAALAKWGSISGKVTDDVTAAALPDICVRVVDASTERRAGSTRTLADGTYKVASVPIGSYKVQFRDCVAPSDYNVLWFKDSQNWSDADVVNVTGEAVRGIDGALIPNRSFTLTLSKAGTGSGSVTSHPSGINCGSNCTQDYLKGTVVTLTAAAAAGSSFTGWSGACSGTLLQTSVTMDASKTCTATFSASPSAPTISSFAPHSGPVGTAVTITGTNLAGASTVMFNNVVQPYFSVDASGTYLTTTVPAGATSGPIWVMTPYGTGSSVDSFIVTASRHLRGLTFSLWGHLVAGGYLTTTDAFPGCYQDATVKIQRHGRWRWNTVVTALTDANGRYHLHVWDRAGRYRAKVTEVILGSGDVCAGAISPVRWHHHG